MEFVPERMARPADRVRGEIARAHLGRHGRRDVTPDRGIVTPSDAVPDANAAPAAEVPGWDGEVEVFAGRGAGRYWRDLWRYRELFFFLAWRDLKVRYKQTTVGVAWAVL